MNAEELILEGVSDPVPEETLNEVPESYGTSEEYIPEETEQPQETTETVGIESSVPSVDYTPIINDASSAICSIIMFCLFAVCGVIASSHIFGGVK